MYSHFAIYLELARTLDKKVIFLLLPLKPGEAFLAASKALPDVSEALPALLKVPQLPLRFTLLPETLLLKPFLFLPRLFLLNNPLT